MRLLGRLRESMRPAPIATGAALQEFLRERALLVAQKCAIDYCRGKTGLASYALFTEKPFLDALASEHSIRLVAAESASQWLDSQIAAVHRALAASRRELATQEVLDLATSGKQRHGADDLATWRRASSPA